MNTKIKKIITDSLFLIVCGLFGIELIVEIGYILKFVITYVITYQP